MKKLGIFAAVIGVIAAVVLIIVGISTSVPEKYVYVSSSSSAYSASWESNTGAQYLGGDAYNYIVEASLKAGYYNAMVLKKTLNIVGGVLLLFISVFFGLSCASAQAKADEEARRLEVLKEIAKNTKGPEEEPAPAVERVRMRRTVEEAPAEAAAPAEEAAAEMVEEAAAAEEAVEKAAEEAAAEDSAAE